MSLCRYCAALSLGSLHLRVMFIPFLLPPFSEQKGGVALLNPRLLVTPYSPPLVHCSLAQKDPGDAH